MPWDGTELWTANLDDSGTPESAEKIAGGPEESVFQPEWSPDGTLHFTSDRTGWWNLYRLRGGMVEPLHERSAEFGRPQWRLGDVRLRLRVADEHRLLLRGARRLPAGAPGYGDRRPGGDREPFSAIGSPQADAGSGETVLVTGSSTEPTSIVRLDSRTGNHEVLRHSGDLEIDAGYLSVPKTVEFPTESGLTAHGFFYPPKNDDYAAPEDELPPLLVLSHGGPTSATATSLDLKIQYWTSRGIAVLDVNYGGSTGLRA